MDSANPQIRPILSITIQPKSLSDLERLQNAVGELLKHNPTVRMSADLEKGPIVISGMAESHLQRVCDGLRQQYEIEIETSNPKVEYVETIRKSAEAEGRYIRQTGGSGNYGHCWLRVEPNEPGKGYEFINDVKGGIVPKEFTKPIDQGIQGALELGILAGFPIVDVKVTLFDGSYHDVDSNEMAFKLAGSIAFKEAARKAHPVVLEPVMAAEINILEQMIGEAIAEIKFREGRIVGMEIAGNARTIKALIPLSEVLSTSVHGCPDYSLRFAGYQAARKHGRSDDDSLSVPAMLPKTPRSGRGSAAAVPDQD